MGQLNFHQVQQEGGEEEEYIQEEDEIQKEGGDRVVDLSNDTVRNQNEGGDYQAGMTAREMATKDGAIYIQEVISVLPKLTYCAFCVFTLIVTAIVLFYTAWYNNAESQKGTCISERITFPPQAIRAQFNWKTNKYKPVRRGNGWVTALKAY